MIKQVLRYEKKMFGNYITFKEMTDGFIEKKDLSEPKENLKKRELDLFPVLITLEKPMLG